MSLTPFRFRYFLAASLLLTLVAWTLIGNLRTPTFNSKPHQNQGDPSSLLPSDLQVNAASTASSEREAVTSAGARTVEGLVVDAVSGLPIMAAVTVESSPHAWVRCDFRGQFELECSSTLGRVDLRVESSGYLTLSVAVEMVHRGLLRVALEPLLVADLLVVDSKDKPILGAVVHGMPSGLRDLPEMVTLGATSDDGRLAIGLAAPWRVQAMHEGRLSGWGMAQPGSSAKLVIAATELQLTITRDLDNGPIPGARVRASDSLGGLSLGKTDESGMLTVPIPAGTWVQIEVQGRGWAALRPPLGRPDSCQAPILSSRL